MYKFDVVLNNRKFTQEMKRYVYSIRITKQSTGASTILLGINDTNMNFIGDVNLYRQGVPATFTAESNGDKLYFKGFIAHLDVEFPDNTIPMINITISDESYILDRIKKTHNWGVRLRSDIARELFTSYGLKTVIDTSVDKPKTSDTDMEQQEITQSNETDMSFLTKLAGEEADEWLCYVENGVGYYCRKKILETPYITLGYKTGNCQIKTFKPNIEQVTKRIEVLQQDIDLISNETVNVSTTNTINVQGG